MPSYAGNEKYKRGQARVIIHRNILLASVPIAMLGSLWILFALSIGGQVLADHGKPVKSVCTNPSIRKEWREHSNAEKKAFLDAVKVSV